MKQKEKTTVCTNENWDADAIASALFQCGRNAKKGWTDGMWKLKGDGSLLTRLDCQNEELLRTTLTALVPGSYFLGEETLADCTEDYLQQAFRGDCWIVDPIDGTAPFAHGFPCWGISVGFMRGGGLTDGGIFLPDQGEMLLTHGESVMYADGIDVLEGSVPRQFRKLPKREEEWTDGGMLMLGQDVTRRCSTGLRNPVMSTGSAVQALASVILGRGMAYIGSVKIYDVAGIFPILSRLGFEIYLPGFGDVTMDLNTGYFDISADAPVRWKLKGNMRVGMPAVVDVLKNRLQLHGE